MKITEIVNYDLVDLINCESEPIHIPGSIQPHGFLIAVRASSLDIEYCSGNVVDHTGLTHEQLLGKRYEEVFGGLQAQALKVYAIGQMMTFASPLPIELQGKKYDGTIHRSGDLLIIEFEVQTNISHDISAFYNQTRQFAGYMGRADSLRMLCQAVAHETRAIIGYDRVMIYRFDKDYNGEVIAESKSDVVESFLGLHYPHTDIPPQARDLYCKNLIRLIADVDYKPVPIYTLGDKSNKDLDLTYSVLRSVSPIHIQYLHNMRVGASLSISLIHEGKLWGLIACHHYSPKVIDNYTRIKAQLQGNFMTSQISVREIAEEYDITKQVNTALDKMQAKEFDLNLEAFHEIVSQPELTELCNARGVAIIIGDTIYKHGGTPNDADIRKFVSWFGTASTNGSYSTSHLAESYADARRVCSDAAGIIFHSLASDHSQSIIWFRPETIKEIIWAGEPDKAIIKDKDSISPRKSFEAWKQIVDCQSIAWKKPELAAAANFAHSLQKYIHTLFISEEETKSRLLNIKLREAYSELENLNWISSHDLKEPLRKIQIFASKIIEADTDNLSSTILETLKKIQSSASRMTTLINDVLSFSRVRQTEDTFVSVDLNEVLRETLSEIADEVAEKQGKITVSKLPVIKGIPLLLNQLFNNLLRNSLKFSKAEVPIEIQIQYGGITSYAAEKDEIFHPFYKIDVLDNGIGFDNKFSQSIFKVFTRLHHQHEYSGTGVGLALCKKIMQNHGGYIIANGIPGEGAVFSLYFPVQENTIQE